VTCLSEQRHNRVALAWLHRAIFTALAAEELEGFRFHEQQALLSTVSIELCLKFFLICEEGCRVSSLSKADRHCKQFGHALQRMIDELTQRPGYDWLSFIGERDFDGFLGKELVSALETGFFESRYPTDSPYYLKFPSKKSKRVWQLPLASSGVSRLRNLILARGLNAAVARVRSRAELWRFIRNATACKAGRSLRAKLLRARER